MHDSLMSVVYFLFVANKHRS